MIITGSLEAALAVFCLMQNMQAYFPRIDTKYSVGFSCHFSLNHQQTQNKIKFKGKLFIKSITVQTSTSLVVGQH